MLSVVIPTLTGREETLKRCRKAYLETGPPDMELITVRDKASWPEACNEGYRKAKGDRLHFTADDLEPLPGWWQEALPWLDDHDELPAPRVFDPDGRWDNAIDGPDGAIPEFTRIPLMTRNQWERIGPWPEYNYVADVWLSGRGRTLGIETRMIHSYAFIHHWKEVPMGRRDSPPELAEANGHLSRLRAAGWA